MAFASTKLLKELPSEDEMRETIMSLILAQDQVVALTGVAYLDSALEILLTARFRTLTKDENKRMFDGSANAILGTTSAKIRLAYAIRLIEPLVYRDLLVINAVRNAFAHSLHKVSFEHPHIVADCETLVPLTKDMDAKSRFSFAVIATYIGLRKKVYQQLLAKKLQEGDQQQPSPDK